VGETRKFKKGDKVFVITGRNQYVRIKKETVSRLNKETYSIEGCYPTFHERDLYTNPHDALDEVTSQIYRHIGVLESQKRFAFQALEDAEEFAADPDKKERERFERMKARMEPEVQAAIDAAQKDKAAGKYYDNDLGYFVQDNAAQQGEPKQ